MDAVISIGGQSFIDGIVRLLGPALQPLRTPMPVALPGLTNSTLSIRRFEPVLPGSRPGEIELEVEFELAGEVLLLASAPLDQVTGEINLGAATGTVSQPARTGTLTTSQGSGTVGPTALALDALSGTVQLAGEPDAALNLGAIAGTLRFPPGGGAIALPFPAVVPVAVDLSRGGPLVARFAGAAGQRQRRRWRRRADRCHHRVWPRLRLQRGERRTAGTADDLCGDARHRNNAGLERCRDPASEGAANPDTAGPKAARHCRRPGHGDSRRRRRR